MSPVVENGIAIVSTSGCVLAGYYKGCLIKMAEHFIAKQ